MKRISKQFGLMIMAYAIATQCFCDAKTDSLKILNTSRTLQSYNESLDTILSTKQLWKPLQIDVDSDVLSKLKKHNTVRTMFFLNMDLKTILAWTVHAANANAIIRDDGSIYIATKAKLKKCDPLFECFKDTDGKWVDELSKQLNAEVIEANLNDDAFIKYLNSFHNRYRISFVVDPMLPQSKVYDTKINTHLDTDETCGDELSSVLKQIGLTYKLQGGVVFITK